PPMIPTPTRRQQEKLRALDARLSAARAAVRALEPTLAAEQARWEKSVTAHVDWSPTDGLARKLDLGGAKFRDGAPAPGAGKVGKAIDLDGKRFVDAGDLGDFGFYDKLSLGAWVDPRGSSGAVLSRMVEAPEGEGYAVVLKAGRVQVNLVKRWLDDAIRVE